MWPLCRILIVYYARNIYLTQVHQNHQVHLRGGFLGTCICLATGSKDSMTTPATKRCSVPPWEEWESSWTTKTKLRPPGKSMAIATPMYWCIIAPYESSPFGGCAIYFRNGVWLFHTLIKLIPTQTMHLLLREIPQNYHTFALLDHPQMDNLIGRRVGKWLSQDKTPYDFPLYILISSYGSLEWFIIIPYNTHITG